MKKIKMFFSNVWHILFFIWALIIHPFQWVHINLKEHYKRKAELAKFNKAKELADHMHASTGKRFHVLPMASGKWEVVDNSYIKHYNKFKGVKKITIYDLLKMSRYSTK